MRGCRRRLRTGPGAEDGACRWRWRKAYPDSSPDASVFGLKGVAPSEPICIDAVVAGLPGRYSGQSPRIGMAVDMVRASASALAIVRGGRARFGRRSRSLRRRKFQTS